MNSNKLSLARIKIKFPDEIWISQIFKNFRDIEMEILYFLPYDLEKSIGNAIIEIVHYDMESIIQEIKHHESVFEFSILEREKNRIKINVKTIDPYLLYGIIKCGILVNFPVNVKEGYAYWRLIGRRDSIDQLLTLFEDKGIKFNLLKIGNSPYILDESTSKLTYKESKILEDAIKLGFFDIPRKISLEELADRLGKSKSALSVMLRKIIKKKVVLET